MIFTCLQLCNVLTIWPELAKIYSSRRLNTFPNYQMFPSCMFSSLTFVIFYMQNLKIRLKYDLDVFFNMFHPYNV